MPTTTLQWLLPDGGAGAKTNDGVANVAGGLPGDRVRFEVTGRRGRTVLGRVTAIEAPGPNRRPPLCPWSEGCGGCDLDGLAPPAQQHHKARMVRHALHLPDDPVLVPSPRPTGYRARITVHVDGGRVGYRRAGSHDLVEIDRCGLARPELGRALARLRAWLHEHGGAGLADVELRSDGERVVFAARSQGDVPRAVRDALPELLDVALDGKRVAGDPVLTLAVANHTLRASPRSFYQVNLEQNEQLVAYVVDALAAIAPARTLDLYAGIGNFSLPLAAATRAPVLAVEREGQALDDLRWAADAAGLDVTALPLPVERFDPSREPFDAVLLDPPRAGAPGVLPRLLQLRPRRIVYVACHPPSAARDLRPAFDAGYRLVDVRAFEMFPDTHHVETVVVVER